MMTQLHRARMGTVAASDLSPDTAMGAAPDDGHISEQEKRSGRRLRNLFLVGNAVAWIVIIFAARTLFF
jgi:hypothetical protein